MLKQMSLWARVHAVRYLSEFIELSGDKQLAEKMRGEAEEQWQKLMNCYPDIPPAIPIGGWEFLENALEDYFVSFVGESKFYDEIGDDDYSFMDYENAKCKPPLWFGDEDEDEEIAE